MRTILCPVDFSASSENAVAYVIELNKEVKAKIILLHAYETPMLYSDVAPFTIQLDYKVLHDAAAQKLKSFYKKHFEDGDKSVEMILQQGLPSARICEIAIEKKVDMIVMGATGTNAAERLIVGSNALRVAKDAHCKVMLIPSKAKFKGLNKIVYATDLTSDNLIQARELFFLAKKFSSELMFLHIDKTVMTNDDEILRTITKKTRQFVSYGKKSGYVCNDTDVTKGVDYFLKKHKADCLAVFHRHRNAWGSVFKTSVSKSVALHATVPVMVLHADDYSN
jgi:nucleotide-binding universal stress UspA family protein